MELYHNNMSVCAQKVRLVLREKGLRPTEHHLNLRAGDQHRPEYVALNPKAVVPTLVDGGAVIIESTIICEYLDDAYPQVPLRPSDPVERARMRLWTLLPDAELHAACGTVSFAIAFRQQYLAMPPDEMERQLAAKPDPKAREIVRRTIELGLDAPQALPALRVYDKALTRIAQQLAETPHLAGREFTLADAAMLPYVCRLEDLGLSFLWEDGRAAIGAWLGRCKDRPGFAGISDYHDPKYRELLLRTGSEERRRVAALLSA